MKRIGVILTFLVFSALEVQVHAQEEAVVIEVRKNVSLSKHDKTYKNYFINGGETLGLKKGSIVDVLRRMPVHDPLKNASIGDIRIKVAEIEIIHADPKISVGKLFKNESPEQRPILDFEAVMVGDRLDLDTVRGPAKAAAAGEEKGALQAAAPGAKNEAKEGERRPASVSAPAVRAKKRVARKPTAVKKPVAGKSGEKKLTRKDTVPNKTLR